MSPPAVTFPHAMGALDDLEQYLRPTWFLDADNPTVIRFAHEAIAGAVEEADRAVRLFYAVRDGVRYDPYTVTAEPTDYRASVILERRAAYCVPKAVLLAAAARSVGIPTRLGFADVRNHLASEKLLAQMGTDVFTYHGFTEFWLGDAWIKATPTFNIELCERFRVQPLEFDGRHDSLFHEFSAEGARHMEYVRSRGSFADLPLTELMAAYRSLYGDSFVEQFPVRDEMFEGSVETVAPPT